MEAEDEASGAPIPIEYPSLVPQVPAFNRTVWQVALLHVATLGFYTVYYLARNFHIAQIRLEKKQRPWWTWFGLIVPLLNLYLFYGGFSRIGERVRAANVDVPVPFGLVAFIMTVVDACYRLPGAWSLVTFAAVLPLIAMHTSVVKAESIECPGQKPKLTVWEIVIIVLGLLFDVFIVDGSLLPAA